MSCGGHILSEDTPELTIKRELEEELGLTNLKTKLVDKYVFSHASQSELIYLYYAIADFDPSKLKLQKKRLRK